MGCIRLLYMCGVVGKVEVVKSVTRDESLYEKDNMYGNERYV